jgi:Fe-Mn family superoxide dismutase
MSKGMGRVIKPFFLIVAVAVAAMTLALSGPVLAQQPALTNENIPVVFTLPALPYSVDALEPVVDAKTMTFHHSRHHQSYVNTLNEAIAADPALADQSLEEIIAKASSLSAVVRNNAGGHWNHSFFWETMAPVTQSGHPSAELVAAINARFGSFDDFKARFMAAGASRFGSGWVWLIVDSDGQLTITSTPNQDNPLMDVAEMKGTPILGNDVWEHAYYLKHQNSRANYLEDWWKVVNWRVVSDRFSVAARR